MKKYLKRFIRDESGQSLMEIIVGLTIGAVLIGTASFGIAFMLRSSSTNQNLATASQLTQGLLNNVQTFSNSDWQNVYGLTKGAGTQYFLNASGTSYVAVQGQEGVVDNDVTNGLAGKWGLDEATGTTAYDATGNNDNGTLTNSPTRVTSNCQIGYCVSFNASTTNYIGVGDPSSGVLDFPTGDFSVAAWVYTPVKDTSSYWHSIASKWVYSTSVGGWGLYSRYGSYYFQLGNAGTCQIMWGGLGAPITQGVWQNVVVTIQRSGNATMYLNGLQASQTGISSFSSCDVSNSYGFNVGSRENGANVFNGNIDDVRVYNRALSVSEVAQLYNTQTFARYFYVQNVCRTSDSSGNIASSTSPCAGGTTDDPLTQQVTAVTNWLVGANTDQVSLVRYITRWGNFSVRQTDWSGGAGQTGPVISPNNLYSSSTNIAVTSTLGSFQILNLTQ